MQVARHPWIHKMTAVGKKIDFKKYSGIKNNKEVGIGSVAAFPCLFPVFPLLESQ